MTSFLKRLLLGLAIVAAQFFVLGRLDLWGVRPDAVLLYVTWVGLRSGRRTGSALGFSLGLVMDALYGTWGLNALIKTIVGFVVGLFPANERETLLVLPQQAFLGGFVVALLHNGLMVLLLALDAGTRNAFLLLELWIGAAIYTGFVAFLAALFASNRLS